LKVNFSQKNTIEILFSWALHVKWNICSFNNISTNFYFQYYLSYICIWTQLLYYFCICTFYVFNWSAYLKHGQCIYDNVIGVDDAIPCLNNYLLAFEHLASDGEHEWRSTICCAHKRKELCTDALAIDHCGSEAREYFEIFFDKIHFGFFDIVCANTDFKPDSEQCEKALPNAGQKPKGLKSKSYISKMLFNYFPFNYVPIAKRSKYQSKIDWNLIVRNSSWMFFFQ